MSFLSLMWVALLLPLTQGTVMTLSGGQLTISGAITATYMDLFINFSANVQWVAMIWSQNEADTDVTLFKLNPTNPAIPVTLVDCYLDQNSFIQSDNVQNLMTSVTGFQGDTSNGIKAAFKRDLSTADTQDITIYPNSVIQVCFISSTVPFQGNGFEKGNQKDCTYISLHKNVNSLSDRLLGNFAATATFGGGNLTVYATQSTDGGNFQSWLFLTVVHKAQGLNPFSPKWLGILYSNSLVNNDMAVIQYKTVGVVLDLNINDYYVVSSTSAATDYSYIVNQGNNDCEPVLTAYDSSAYLVGSYKRKFYTGDTNRDAVLTNGPNTYCFIYGDGLAFSTFKQQEKVCFDFDLVTEYTSNFRESSSTSVNVQTYVAPPNTVLVKTSGGSYFYLSLLLLWVWLA